MGDLVWCPMALWHYGNGCCWGRMYNDDMMGYRMPPGPEIYWDLFGNLGMDVAFLKMFFKKHAIHDRCSCNFASSRVFKSNMFIPNCHVHSKSLHFCCWNRSYAKTSPRHIINSKNYSWLLWHGHHMTSYYVWCVFQLMESSLLALPTSIGGSICKTLVLDSANRYEAFGHRCMVQLGMDGLLDLAIVVASFQGRVPGRPKWGPWGLTCRTDEVFPTSDKNQSAKGF